MPKDQSGTSATGPPIINNDKMKQSSISVSSSGSLHSYGNLTFPLANVSSPVRLPSQLNFTDGPPVGEIETTTLQTDSYETVEAATDENAWGHNTVLPGKYSAFS